MKGWGWQIFQASQIVVPGGQGYWEVVLNKDLGVRNKTRSPGDKLVYRI
jgi:hypothetical protein